MTKFKQIFNSTTIRGRANVAKATYASFAVLYLYSRFKKNKKKPVEKSQDDDLNHTQEPDDFESSENFRCPHCECGMDKNSSDTKLNTENLPPLDPNTAMRKSSKSNHNQDNGVSAAEAFVKSSKSKCDDGCKQNTSAPFKTTNENKSQFFADDKDALWWYTL